VFLLFCQPPFLVIIVLMIALFSVFFFLMPYLNDFVFIYVYLCLLSFYLSFSCFTYTLYCILFCCLLKNYKFLSDFKDSFAFKLNNFSCFMFTFFKKSFFLFSLCFRYFQTLYLLSKNLLFLLNLIIYFS